MMSVLTLSALGNGACIEMTEGQGLCLEAIVRWAAIVVVGLQVGGCFEDYGPVVSDSVPARPPALLRRLQSGDQVKVIVFGEDALSGHLRHQPSRHHFDAADRTDHGGWAHDRKLGASPSPGNMPAANSCKNRRLLFLLPAFGHFTYFGEVLTPGRYAYTDGLDVLGAVATAGGFTYRASSPLFSFGIRETTSGSNIPWQILNSLSQETLFEFRSATTDKRRVADRQST